MTDPYAKTGFWTAPRTKILREMHADGFYFSEIAAAIPGSSRASVSGKINRLNLPTPAVERKRPVKKPKPKAGGFRFSRIGSPEPKTAPIAIFDPKPSPDSKPISLLKISGHRCRYMLDSATCCGAAAKEGRSYCEFHHERCTVPMMPRKST